MKPYYDADGVTIYHGDCAEILPTLPKVDLVLTDPPYAIGAGKSEWAATAQVAIGLREAARKVRKNGAMLCFSTSSARGIDYIRGAVGRSLLFNRVLVWHKALTTSKAAGPWKWDVVLILAFGRATFDTAERSGMLSTTEPRFGREHPAQVPLDVAEWLYFPFRPLPNIVTVDPFMGSGRLLLPARGFNQRVIGIEQEERYCELAVRTLTGRPTTEATA